MLAPSNDSKGGKAILRVESIPPTPSSIISIPCATTPMKRARIDAMETGSKVDTRGQKDTFLPSFLREDGSLTKFGNTVIEVLQLCGYTAVAVRRWKQKQWQRWALDHSSCIRVKPGLWGGGQAEAGDRRLQWHLRQISIWITGAPSSTPPLHTHARVSVSSYAPLSSPSLDILCLLLPSPSALCTISIQSRLSVAQQLREVAEASSWPNCSATYPWARIQRSLGSCFREFWTSRYLHGLFAIFHYACE